MVVSFLMFLKSTKHDIVKLVYNTPWNLLVVYNFQLQIPYGSMCFLQQFTALLKQKTELIRLQQGSWNKQLCLCCALKKLVYCNFAIFTPMPCWLIVYRYLSGQRCVTTTQKWKEFSCYKIKTLLKLMAIPLNFFWSIFLRGLLVDVVLLLLLPHT